MRVIVIGMGEVGKHTASVLAAEKHDITIIDESAINLARAEEMMDVLALRGNGASIKTLRQARVDKADLVIAVSDRDEANMLAALTAKKLGARRTVARVADREYLDDAESGFYHDVLTIDLVISVPILTAIEIHRLIKSVGAIAVQVFADNRVEMIQLPIKDDLGIVKKPLRDVRLPDNCLVAAILRSDELIIPGGADAILPGDQVFLIGTIENIPRLEKMFGKTEKESARKVVIVGGGDVGFSVARLLERDPTHVILIDNDSERCAELSRALHRTVIINGDGTDLALLREEKMSNCDVFVATTGDDEVNLTSSLLARSLGSSKTVTLVNKPDYISIYGILGIDATVSPRRFASNQILKYVREGEVVSVSMLADGKAEILEVIPSDGSRIANKPLKDVNFPRGAVVAAVAGPEGAFVPKGDHVIKPGNSVVVLTTPQMRPAVERLFRKKLFSLV